MDTQDHSQVDNVDFFHEDGNPNIPLIDLYLQLQISDVNDAVSNLQRAQQKNSTEFRGLLNTVITI